MSAALTLVALALVSARPGIDDTRARTSTAASAERARDLHRALVLPTISGELVPRDPRLDERTLAAFSGALVDAAVDVLAWRRFDVVAGEPAATALLAHGGAAECRNEACAREVALGVGASHVVFSRLTRLKDGSCTAVATMLEVFDASRDRTARDEIKPCSADNVLARGLDLGRKVAEGPRAPLRVTLDLTPRTLPTIDLPDLPNIGEYATSTVARTRRGGMTLDRALEIYEAKHMFVFEDDGHPGKFYVARNRRAISECDVRRAASAPIAVDMLEFCEGNNWEWAWIGLPIGVLLSSVGATKLDSGGGFQFALGGAISIGSIVLGGFFNVDAVDVEDGVHYSSREEIERIVAKSNADLREVLDLTEAEVTVAGMRR